MTTPLRPGLRRRGLGAIFAIACLMAFPVRTAADGGSASPLDVEIVDVAFVERAGPAWPDLLTLDTSPEAAGEARVRLLRRDDVWSTVAETWSTVAETKFDVTVSGDTATPWIVELGGGRFAVLGIDGELGKTIVVPVHLGGTAGQPALRVGAAVVVDIVADAAGAADVDGTGRAALVIAGCCTGQRDLRCPLDDGQVTIQVLHGDDLATGAAQQIPGFDLGGAALGEWDGIPGADILADAYERPCNDDDQLPHPAPNHHLLAMRLRDGATIVDIPDPEIGTSNEPLSRPMVVDVDGDGRDEAVITTATGLTIVDPANDWRATTIADGDATPLSTTDLQGESLSPFPVASALVTWMASIDEAPGLALGSARIERVDGALVTDEQGERPEGYAYERIQPLSGVDSASVVDAVRFRLRSASAWRPPPVWSGDDDGDGCPELIAPLVQVDCPGLGIARPGSAWLGTRPLGLVGPAGDRRLLVAESVEPFYADADPSPAAATAPGAWRNGPSGPFVLAESAVPPSADQAEPDLSPTVATTISPAGTIDLSAPTGTRLLVRSSASLTGSTPPLTEPGPSLDELLQGIPGRAIGDFRTLRIPVPNGTVAGSTVGSVPLDLGPPPIARDGGPGISWIVTVGALDASGNVSSLVETIATYDLTAPLLELAAPLLSPPWPFEATLEGRSEAGVSVRLGSGPSVVADATGAFTMRTQLAPWPQTLDLTAADPNGNVTAAHVSVIGGFDVRQLPWPAIATVGVLMAVAYSSVRASRHARQEAPVAIVPNDDDPPMIEDLGERHIRRG